MTFFIPQAERKNVKISFLKGTGLPRIMADKVQLDRVIGNILGNALKFVPSGSSITVSTKAADDGIEIAISDTGKGIPEKDVDTGFSAPCGSAVGRLSCSLVNARTRQVESDSLAGSFFHRPLPRNFRGVLASHCHKHDHIHTRRAAGHGRRPPTEPVPGRLLASHIRCIRAAGSRGYHRGHIHARPVLRHPCIRACVGGGASCCDRRTIALAVGFVLALLMSLGSHFFARVAAHDYLSLLNFSRFPAADSRAMAALAGSLLAGAGLASVWEEASARRSLFRVLGGWWFFFSLASFG